MQFYISIYFTLSELDSRVSAPTGFKYMQYIKTLVCRSRQCKHQIKLKIILYSNEQDMLHIQYSEQRF